jgi:hypothetical protein
MVSTQIYLVLYNFNACEANLQKLGLQILLRGTHIARYSVYDIGIMTVTYNIYDIDYGDSLHK